MSDNDVPYETVSELKLATRASELEVMLPDTRGVTVSRFGKGNLKLGPNVLTYSRLPGKPKPHGGTCPGATSECISICYAFAINDGSPVWDVYKRNSETSEVPPIPEGTKLMRWHVSGDFDTPKYIEEWTLRTIENPDTKFWGYTRAWRVNALVDSLEFLRARPNVQLFASMDSSDDLLPPEGWRRSWLSNDPRAYPMGEDAEPGHNPLIELGEGVRRQWWSDLPTALMPPSTALLCPEEMGDLPSCQACGYCINRRTENDMGGNDVLFVVH